MTRDRRARVEVQGVWLRLGVSVALAIAAALVMVLTAANVGFWMEPSEPRDLGDLRQQWVAGVTTPLGPDNGHVEMRGLVPTRLVTVSSKAPADASGAEDRALLFFCPLRQIVVLTPRHLSVDPAMAGEADGDLARLVDDRLALPEETALSVAVSGRLLRGDAVSGDLAPFVQSFAQRMQRSPAELWVLLDGATPSDETWAIVVWALAAAAPLISLIFLARAVRRTRPAGGTT